MQARRRSTPNRTTIPNLSSFFPQSSPIRRYMIPADFRQQSPPAQDSVISVVNITSTSTDYNGSTEGASLEQRKCRTPAHYDWLPGKRLATNSTSPSPKRARPQPPIHSTANRQLVFKSTFDHDSTPESIDSSWDPSVPIPTHAIKIIFEDISKDDVFKQESTNPIQLSPAAIQLSDNATA